MKSARLLASCLALILCSAAAYADSPITSPQIRTSIDNWLGSAFRGESYSPRQVDRIGQKLVGEIGQKQTSIGAVFDAVQTFHGAAFGIQDPVQRKQAIKKFSGRLKKAWKEGDGGANAAAAYSMNDVYTTLFTGSRAQVQNVEKTAGYRRLRSLQSSTRSPSFDVFVGMVKHYKDAFGHGSWDGTTKASRQAVRTWSLAATKLIGSGNRASTHSRNLLKKTLDYSQYYDGVYKAGAQQVSRILSSRAPKQVRLQQLRQLRKGSLKIGR